MNKLEARRAARRQADMLSVRALAGLLRGVAAEPGKHLQDSALQAALRSQGALAKHAVPSASIHAMTSG
jgi:hypothetical protein